MATKNNKSKKKSKSVRIRNIILLVVEVVFLGVIIYLFNLTKTATDPETGVERIEINEEEIVLQMNEKVVESEVLKGYTNIALFGCDSRLKVLSNGDNRSDTIIIASINNETSEVKLLSVYRDTYLNQKGPYGNYGKCNASYASGGPEQAILMLNSNLDLDITDFVTIGFEGVRDIVDALGGVYVSIEADEIEHLNNYQYSMRDTMPDVDTVVKVEQTGYQLLNGLQAVAYCRIRYTAGNDFKRTERQREVIKACLDAAKTASPATLDAACRNIFGEVYTSLDLTDILSVLSHITSYSIVDEGGFPTKGQITTGTIGNKGSCVIPLSLETNVKWAHEFLFGETDYEVSSEIKEYSQRIYNETNPYLSGTVQE